jgi:(p)ppGpp synthase/HD superfamily hydrolase
MMGYEKARLFAKAAHAAVGQMRKYTDEPYIVHPVEVAGIVRYWGGTDTMCVAALLHDVLEDTKIT